MYKIAEKYFFLKTLKKNVIDLATCFTDSVSSRIKVYGRTIIPLGKNVRESPWKNRCPEISEAKLKVQKLSKYAGKHKRRLIKQLLNTENYVKHFMGHE